MNYILSEEEYQRLKNGDAEKLRKWKLAILKRVSEVVKGSMFASDNFTMKRVIAAINDPVEEPPSPGIVPN